MATADGSFALTEVEEALLRVNEPRSCNCSGVCARKRGRGACPCKSMDEYCNRACTCGKKRACVNRLPDSTSEEDEEDRSADTSRKRSRESHESHHLTAEEMMEENERQMKEFVQQKTKEELECLTLELLRRQPGAWADLQQQLPYPAPQPGPNPGSSPPWCKCGQCQDMPTQAEKKCCATRQSQGCITNKGLFNYLVLDANVLELAMRWNADTYAEEHQRDNACFRHFAYRQYIYWQHGRLGAGNRRVVPSCCVWAIRRKFPSPNNIYVGYRDGEIQD
ncbi:uncharacterized protein [Ptychodera flava]|uniref:uncharacterized protein n=1 Tax=Ptychodera flava TaxID=63121 RepID=UPI00396AA9B6